METRWNAMIVRGFEAAFRPWMRRRLTGIHVTGLPSALPAGVPVLMVANHVSWWDGFILREVQRLAGSTDPLVTLMREDQLRRYPFFRWMGVIGLTQSALGTRRALRHVDSFRSQTPVWMSFFPQGRIWPSWKNPLAFRPGLKLFAESLRPVVILPVGIHLEMLGKPIPTAFASVGEVLLVKSGDPVPPIARVEEAVAEALGIIFGLLEMWGEDLPHYWPEVRRPDVPFVLRAREPSIVNDPA